MKTALDPVEQAEEAHDDDNGKEEQDRSAHEGGPTGNPAGTSPTMCIEQLLLYQHTKQHKCDRCAECCLTQDTDQAGGASSMHVAHSLQEY